MKLLEDTITIKELRQLMLEHIEAEPTTVIWLVDTLNTYDDDYKLNSNKKVLMFVIYMAIEMLRSGRRKELLEGLNTLTEYFDQEKQRLREQMFDTLVVDDQF